ncbi:MAG: hypothetical protein K6T71_03010 [Candidatus Bipolaricaulota bacterium]|nr:hypothetical protein [Candidatus Bipolaricaulota bacterium]
MVLLVALGVLMWRGPRASPLLRGMNYVINPDHTHTLEEDLHQMRALGVQQIAIVIPWYQAELHATEIRPDPQRSPSDEQIVQLIRRMTAMGLRAFLRPMVEVQDGHWRGEIAFDEDEQWAIWFQSYERFILHYAQLAAREAVALFSVGVELEGAVWREPSWRELIARVRTIYPGPLTYSANWDGLAQVPFWDALEYVGIDAYFDLAVGPEPSVGALRAAWQPWVHHLEHFAAQVRKPILFTEVGVRSVRGASRHPWDWRHQAPISLQEQANYYEAFFQVFWRQPWLAGVYIWAWVPGQGGPEDPSYTPAGKPAAAILQRWYTQRPY